MSSVPPPSDPYGKPQSSGSGDGANAWQKPDDRSRNQQGWSQESWSQQGPGAPGGAASGAPNQPQGWQQGPAGQNGPQAPGWQNPNGPAAGQQNVWGAGAQNQPPQQWGQQPPQNSWNGAGSTNKRVLWGKILTFGGAGVLLLSILAMVLGGAGLLSSVSHLADDAVIVRADKTSTTSLDEGKTYILYRVEGEEISSAGCTVDGPGDIKTGVDNTQYTVTKDARTWVSQESFTVSKTGSYSFTCSSIHDVMIGEPVTAAGLGGAMTMVLGGVAGFLGFAALVVGIILWIVGSRRRTVAY